MIKYLPEGLFESYRIMTFIVSAVTKNIAVVGADGLGFGGADGTVPVETNRCKLFPIAGRKVIVAVHGQDKLTVIGKPEKPIGSIFDDLAPVLSRVMTVKDIADKLYDLLSRHIDHTFRLLKNSHNFETVLGLCVIGFDTDGGKPKGFEAFWPKLSVGENPSVKPLFHTEPVMYSGLGGEYAPKFYDKNKLIDASEHQLQTFVRSLYERADLSQHQHAACKFGGQYHEVTITQEQLKWTTSI